MLRNKNNKKIFFKFYAGTMLVETSLIFTKVTYFNPVHKY